MPPKSVDPVSGVPVLKEYGDKKSPPPPPSCVCARGALSSCSSRAPDRAGCPVVCRLFARARVVAGRTARRRDARGAGQTCVGPASFVGGWELVGASFRGAGVAPGARGVHADAGGRA